MVLTGSTLLPPAKQLHRESQIVQEQIRKKQQKQDFEKTLQEELQRKHSKVRQKIIIVANRLPTKPIIDSEGNITFERCSGGLVSCLAGIQGLFDMVWLGWPGVEIPEADKDFVMQEAMKQNCYPVFLSQEIIEEYYNGFANNVLWPLFHYIMPPFDKGVNECSTEQWEAYKKANELFVEAILQVYEDDDYVWIHDYHLMMTPKMLRDAKPDCNIGWFLHTPFPSAEIYRTLPWRQEIVESLLHANLLGFHVYDYLRHFLSSCAQLTSLEISAHSVDATSIGGCIVTCVTVPVGIHPVDFSNALASTEVQEQTEKLREQYGDRKVILGIDRLDYTKGLPHKLMSFGCFLDQHPDWASKCVLVQLAVPSRRDVPEYQRLQRQVHELVGQICGRHSTLETGAPVIYLDQSMNFHDLVALYQVADVALITSLRDGMNLVAYEYIASHKNNPDPGVLILSEFTGAAQSLGAGAIRVNPWNLQDTANAIYDALEMSTEDRIGLHKYAMSYVKEHTSQKWAETFLQCLQEACSDAVKVTAEVPQLLPYEDLLTDWSESTRRLIVIDLLECLVPVNRRAGTHRGHSRAKLVNLPAELKACLETIAASPNTTIVITTDKSRQDLERVAGSLPVIQAAEGCCVYRRPGEREWVPLMEEDDMEERKDWMDGVKVVFDYFRQRTPGSYIDKQEYQLRWHWDNTQSDFGTAQAREVLINLWAGPLVNSEAEVVVGDRFIAVRPHACARSACLERLLMSEVGEEELKKIDFAMCFAVVAHRDEDVFETLQNLMGNGDDDDQSLDPSQAGSSEVGDAGTETNSPEETRMTPDQSAGHGSCASGKIDAFLQTPPGPAPEPAPGELPPLYDWVPTAQREREQAGEPQRGSTLAEEIPQLQLPPSSVADSDDDGPNYCTCYTLSLGLRKTKAHHTLPHPYHVQNLIRARAARLPQRSDEVYLAQM